MEKIEETLSLGVAIILSEICEQLLVKSTRKEDGTISREDRALPFRLRYRLTRNKLAFDKDVEFFNKQRMILLAQYGELTEDGVNVVIKDPQKMEAYRAQVQALFDTEVTHNIIKLEDEDVDQVKDIDINLSSDALSIFIGYMTNDTALLEDLSKEITINPTFKDFKVPETPVVEKTPETVSVSEEKIRQPIRITEPESEPTIPTEPEVVPEPVVEAPVEEVKTVKKRTTKKKVEE